MMSQVKPPRSVFVNFPLGRQCGRPRDIDLQVRILKDALNVLATATTPGEIVDLPYAWDRPFDFSGYLQDMQDMIRDQNGTVEN
jgi:hypothetical protein